MKYELDLNKSILQNIKDYKRQKKELLLNKFNATMIGKFVNKNFDLSYIEPIVQYELTLMLGIVVVIEIMCLINYSWVETNVWNALSLSNVLAYAITFLVLFIGNWKTIKKEYFKPIKKKLVITSLLGFAGLSIVSYGGEFLAENTISVMNLSSAGTGLNQLMIEKMASASGVWMVVMTVLGALIEEFIFRYCLMNLIRNKKLAMIVSTLLFAILHIQGFGASELIMLSLYLAIGFAFSYAYYKTNDIRISTIIHVLNNLIESIALVF